MIAGRLHVAWFHDAAGVVDAAELADAVGVGPYHAEQFVAVLAEFAAGDRYWVAAAYSFQSQLIPVAVAESEPAFAAVVVAAAAVGSSCSAAGLVDRTLVET